MVKSKKLEWVLTAIIAPIIASATYDFVKEKPILSTLTSILKSIGNFIVTVLTTDLKLWWVLIAIVVFIIGKAILQAAMAEKEPDLPDFYNYRSERFKNWMWKWEWVLNEGTNKWQLTRLKPYCPKCDIVLIEYYDNSAKCPKCEKYFGDAYIDDSQSVALIIFDNVEKKKY